MRGSPATLSATLSATPGTMDMDRSTARFRFGATLGVLLIAAEFTGADTPSPLGHRGPPAEAGVVRLGRGAHHRGQRHSMAVTARRLAQEHGPGRSAALA